mmetsp:Transcript_30072/g.72624  ORF Transcript_30072/g.72624 Transcript_30072/m.72624 type:complete len:126 (+) Transcript_30072:1551-1928(+)
MHRQRVSRWSGLRKEGARWKYVLGRASLTFRIRECRNGEVSLILVSSTGSSVDYHAHRAKQLYPSCDNLCMLMSKIWIVGRTPPNGNFIHNCICYSKNSHSLAWTFESEISVDPNHNESQPKHTY